MSSMMENVGVYSDVCRDFFGRPISAGRFVWGPGGKAPGSSKDLLLWNHLLFIEIYPPQPVMKLIQRIFSKILRKFEFEVNFRIVRFLNSWRPCLLTNYLSQCILRKIYWTNKKLFWGLSLGTQTSIPASKSLWMSITCHEYKQQK